MRTSTADAEPGARQAEVHVLYGSETGNAEFLCDDLVEALGEHGIRSSSTPLDDVTVEDLSAMGTALIVVSTTGEGDMPYGADTFWERIDTDQATGCPGLRYAVLALGDSTYMYFCEAGALIDTRLAELGATRIADRVDCDASYDARARAWIRERVEQLAEPALETAADSDGLDTDGWDPDDWGAGLLGDEDAPPATVFGGTVFGGTVFDSTVPTRSPWTREHPFAAELVSAVRLVRPDSSRSSGREVLHCELDLGDSGIALQPGDSLGVIATNDSFAVDRFLEAAGLNGREPVDGQPLVVLAREKWELRFPSAALLAAIAARAPKSLLAELVATGRRARLDDWVDGHGVADALALLPYPFTPTDLAQLMRPVRARAYSVASSARTHPGRAHLTVAVERPQSTTMRSGVASGCLADRTAPGDQVHVFPLPNRSFRLPDDPAAPIIMVGPGVGVAPFRAFLQERSQQAAAGPTWLFFGNHHVDSDFLYRDEWARLRETGVLTRLNTAFSRDQQEKIYVQDRMREHAADLVRWLEDGAYWYVCGDAHRMAPDVASALEEILIEQLGARDGAALLARIHDEQRYRTDVY